MLQPEGDSFNTFRCGDGAIKWKEDDAPGTQTVEWLYWMVLYYTSMEATDDYGLWMQLQARHYGD